MLDLWLVFLFSELAFPFGEPSESTLLLNAAVSVVVRISIRMTPPRWISVRNADHSVVGTGSADASRVTAG
ncbi:MAG: hypothetical protein ACRDRP_02545 [Pseudonocardiaceae bacterium]